MEWEERVYQVALTQVPHIGHVHAKTLALHFGSASAIFQSGFDALAAIDGIGMARANALLRYRQFEHCQKIVDKSDALTSELVFITDQRYPSTLLQCYDPPTLLYCKGREVMERVRRLSVVGTRHHTEYGRSQTEKIIAELRPHAPVIVSGMAYGIDGIAHRAALKYGLPTLGVLAHGLHTVYPPEHQSLAAEILEKGGGFITEFAPGVAPDRFNFPIRNRIVAGISPVLLVIETGRKGGSMITASLAAGYNSQVYALPGRRTDKRSEGCNYLLYNRTAVPFYSTIALVEEQLWSMPELAPKISTPVYLPDTVEAVLLNLLEVHGPLSVDDLYILSGLPSGTAAGAILALELQQMITVLPGKRYQRCV